MEALLACRHWRFQHTSHMCSAEKIDSLKDFLIQQDMWGPLLVTPCELWPYIRGRTLWILGDSQVCVALKQCANNKDQLAASSMLCVLAIFAPSI